MIICKNCNTPLEGNFCSECGQAAGTHEINSHFLWHDIQQGLLNLDKGILFTIKELSTRPGYSIKEFIAGRRVQHFKPISFVLVLAGIYGFIIHYFDITSFIKAIPDVDTQKVVNITKIIDWISANYALSTLILIPISSLSTYWAFKKEHYNFIQHIVINAFISGFHIILRLIFFPLIFLFDKKEGIGILTIPDIIGFAYTFWVLFQLFDHLPLKSRIMKIILSYFYLGLVYLLFVFLSGAVVGFLLARLEHLK